NLSHRKCFGKGEGLPTWPLYSWEGNSRVDEIILARVSSGFAGKKYGRTSKLYLVALEVGAAVVASPASVPELDTHSSSEADPSESSIPLVSVAPMVLPFLCSDDSESDTKMSERHVSPTPHDAMLTRWRGRVASRSSSPTTSTPEIPTAPILPAPSAVVAPSSEFPLAPGIDREEVGHSSSYHSSSGHSISCHFLSGHASPDTTIADSSTPPRFVYPPLARTPRCSAAYLCWRSAPLSTMYPLTTSESLARDSSSESSAGPSRKRYRSLAAIVTSSIHVMIALVPSRTDLLPPCKRFRDSISPKDNIKEDIDMDVLADIEADATADEVVVDRDVEVGVDVGIGIEVKVGVDVENKVENEVESSDRGTIEVGVDVVVRIDIPDGMLMPDARIEDIEMGQRELEARNLIAGGERASLLEQVASLERSNNMTITRSGMTPEVIKEHVNRRVEEALAAYEATRAANALEAESQSQNGSDGDNGNGGNGNGGDGNGGDGNGGNGNGGNGNPNENNRGARPVARECTYQDFMKCQPLNFKGTEGVVGLIRWFEKMETVFHISNCPEKYQVKYATCTLLNSALTWWNSHKRTVRTETAFAMSWRAHEVNG
ncbi:hypothetical protein Tco_0915333, partial [Tanacetum coccineum]